MSEGKVHHMTLKKMVREGTLTRTLADDVQRGEETMENALALMHERGENSEHYDSEGNVRADTPPKSESRISKDDRTTSKTCLCGCGETLASGKRNFRQGHDTRLSRMSKEYVRGERELTPEQLEYAQDSGKLDKAKAQVEKERQRKQERAQAKAESKKAESKKAES